MKAASVKEIKTELQMLFPGQLLNICMHLIKYKKENKEFLSYLLFEAQDEPNYISEIKLLLDEQFQNVNDSSLYLAKKTIRKALRTANKHLKYSGLKQTEVEVLIYYCKKVRETRLSLKENTVLGNLYQRQLIRINKALSTLHEDLQYDYSEEIKELIL